MSDRGDEAVSLLTQLGCGAAVSRLEGRKYKESTLG
jgi:hypothetical protein